MLRGVTICGHAFSTFMIGQDGFGVGLSTKKTTTLARFRTHMVLLERELMLLDRT